MADAPSAIAPIDNTHTVPFTPQQISRLGVTFAQHAKRNRDDGWNSDISGLAAFIRRQNP